jgi:serine protease Do
VVAGINTLKAYFRQSANYAIPGRAAIEFINKTLNPQTVNEREILDARISAFTGDLKGVKTVYRDIAKYLSYVCIAQNAEYAISELEDRTNRVGSTTRTVFNDIAEAFNHDPVEGMRFAVAWVLETSLRNRAGDIKIELREVRELSPAEYAVTFDINGTGTESRWVKEYGVWRINSFGAAVTGDKSLVEARAQRRARAERLLTEFDFMIQGGYTQILDRGSGINAALKFGGYSYVNIGFVYAMDSDLLNFLVSPGFGFYFPIRLNSFAIMPLFEADFGFMRTNGINTRKAEYTTVTRIGVSIQGGLMLTTAAVRGLYAYAAYQRNFYLDFGLDDESIKPDKSYILLGMGYGL